MSPECIHFIYRCYKKDGYCLALNGFSCDTICVLCFSRNGLTLCHLIHSVWAIETLNWCFQRGSRPLNSRDTISRPSDKSLRVNSSKWETLLFSSCAMCLTYTCLAGLKYSSPHGNRCPTCRSSIRDFLQGDGKGGREDRPQELRCMTYMTYSLNPVNASGHMNTYLPRALFWFPLAGQISSWLDESPANLMQLRYFLFSPSAFRSPCTLHELSHLKIRMNQTFLNTSAVKNRKRKNRKYKLGKVHLMLFAYKKSLPLVLK